ncbi:recombinase family protein [Deinococcus budaensis]|uniref:DNA invertase Pin-like site-specific DNA recombinase n=1 Tax=Deinococcus budaensis TaxID=1665626 RepID=A0A7W8LRP0_9DEIO|nr:recombinase family protein [Deinococcus budaensis]MBB5235837.1 DNA invertase Pin-like site-specific DNA recombinase [Deinococcus budaensis]
MALTFITYSRVSTRSQGDSWSPITQLNSCHEFGISQGWKPYKKEPHIHDTQTGVSYEERKGIQRALELVRAGLVQRVIINDIDRAGRDGEKLRKFIEDIYQIKGARPIISLDSREFASADEFIQAYHFQIAVAEHNRRKIIIETRRGMKTAFRAGAYLTSPPFGYQRAKELVSVSGMQVNVTKLKPNPIDSDLVRQGLEYFAETQSYRQAAVMLNKYNLVKNPERRRSFIATSMTRMFDNLDLYLGLPYVVTREINGEKLTQTQQHEPIITQQLAERVRTADKLRNRDIPGTLPKPFRRLITCSCCGNLAKVCTKTPANTKRVSDYHYTICFGRSKSQNYARVGLPHLVKETKCNSEIGTSKFIKHLNQFLDTLDDGLFQTKLEEIIANRISEVRHTGYSIDELEEEKEQLINELAETENKIVNLAGGELGRVGAVLERKLDNIETNLERVRESIQEKTELYAKEISELSSMGISREALESVQIEEDKETVHLAKMILERSQAGADVAELGELILKAGTFAEQKERELNSSFFRELVVSHSLKITELLGTLRTSLAAKDWTTVNETMAAIGLSFVGDYSERDREKRVASIRLVMHGDISLPYSPDLSGGCGSGNGAARGRCPAGTR